ncbi:hypothetical protein BRAS3843_1130003 [Bradyrhizobium sp. STM 3843]|uniref:SAM-dependent methyltransferase n=1 Tax=Bradyrhizobium sp. STM 3843 TaxID=551947 RepID=UPI00024066A8|nr:SAM-dependent methyltransferase [Bradyrhizobium sp. STM 3843]CCE04772.1 hypothetical protein BRAS3843_1130003 [Bradyrhizobium sp. STM 3843]
MRAKRSTWVVDALVQYLPRRLHVLEPAAGNGDMVHALVAHGYSVTCSDIRDGVDFLKMSKAPHGVAAIITNPPYHAIKNVSQAQRFIEHALALMEPVDGLVAMLLKAEFDTATGRGHLFGRCPMFAKKITLTERIVWFPETGGRPSENHAWFVWDFRHRGLPDPIYVYERPQGQGP